MSFIGTPQFFSKGIMGSKVYLWVGLESVDWTTAQFQPLITYLKAHQLDGAYIKVFDGMMGEWYGGHFDAIHALFTINGLEAIPFGFHYGNNKGSSLTGEASLAIKYLTAYGAYCANMESSWDNQYTWMQQFATYMKNAATNRRFYISTWANIGNNSHLWVDNISALKTVTNRFMPQAYSDDLYQAMLTQWASSNVPLLPTFDLSQEDGTNNPIQSAQDFFARSSTVEQISLWEWGSIGDSSLVDGIVKIAKGGVTKPVILSSKGTVCDVTQSNQLIDVQDSQDKCGPAAVAALKYAGLPDKGGTGTALDIENLEDIWYTQYIGPNVPTNDYGSSIDNMHSFLHDAGNLHYQDIATISPNSVQSTDSATIRAAVRAGFPVLVTALEQSVYSRHLQTCPYPWQPGLGNVGHIFPVVGIDSHGDFICADQLNSFEPWPQVYAADKINVTWASVVQLVGPDSTNPWLATVPGDNPLTWPIGFNAQQFGVTPVHGINDMKVSVWTAVIPDLSRTSGIWLAWTQDFNNKIYRGSPISPEIHTWDENGNPCILQVFSGGFIAKWQNGSLQAWLHA